MCDMCTLYYIYIHNVYYVYSMHMHNICTYNNYYRSLLRFFFFPRDHGIISSTACEEISAKEPWGQPRNSDPLGTSQAHHRQPCTGYVGIGFHLPSLVKVAILRGLSRGRKSIDR